MFLTNKDHSRRRKVALATCILGVVAFFGAPAVLDGFDAALDIVEDWELKSPEGLDEEGVLKMKALAGDEARAVDEYRRSLEVYKASTGWLGSCTTETCQSNRALTVERGLQVENIRQQRRDERRALRRHEYRATRVTELVQLGKEYSRMLRRDERRAVQAAERPQRRAERRAARNPGTRAERQAVRNPERRRARQQARRDERAAGRLQALLDNLFGGDRR